MHGRGVCLLHGWPGFSLTIGQHIGAFGKNLCIDLTDFIKNKHVVVMQGGDAFQSVVGRSPEACWVGYRGMRQLHEC